jgi:hypothetical protein
LKTYVGDSNSDLLRRLLVFYLLQWKDVNNCTHRECNAQEDERNYNGRIGMEHSGLFDLDSFTDAFVQKYKTSNNVGKE